MTENKYNQNQTQFTVEEPLLERPVQITPESAVLAVPPKPRPKWLWGVVGLLGILLLLVIVTVLKGPAPPAPADQTTQPTVNQRPLTPLEQRLETAKALLRDANPTIPVLPFPPLNMTLRIDDP